MNKITHLGGIAALTIGVPLAAQPFFAQAEPTIEQCHFDGTDWVYQDDTLCRGTGEDPTEDSYGRPSCADHRTAIQQGNGRVQCVTVYTVKEV